jgi:hypothetical protein
MKTTENVLEMGLYSSDCCNHERIFTTLEVFQRCPKCLSLCEWEMAETVTDSRELEREAA